MRIFSNRADKSAFLSHVRSAHSSTRFGIYAALGLKYVFGSKLRSIPVLRIVDGSISALIKMHEGTKDEIYCAFNTSCTLNEEMHPIDLIVVGSGPGAGIVAAKNQMHGKKILVIEKGQPLDHKVPHHSPEQMKYFFESGGQELIYSLPPIPFAQGSVLGGGSEINSGLYHRLPSKSLRFWLDQTGLDEKKWHEAEAAVERDLKVSLQSTESLGVYKHSPISKMQKELEWDGGLIPRWRTYNGANFVHHGMDSTYLQFARSNDAKIVSGHEVLKVRLVDSGVEVLVKCSNGLHKLRAKQVCLSAGTLGTPRLLWRSKLAKAREFKFKFHAMVREIARFPEDVSDLNDIDPFQTWHTAKDFKIGAAVSTPRLLAATLASKGLKVPPLEEMSRLGVYYISLKSHGKNGLLGIGTRLVPFFWPSKKMRQSLSEAQAVLRDAVKRIGGSPLGNSGPSISTVHVFGSISLGESKILDNKGNVRGTEGKIFVRDSSILPSHPSVNPQGPLMHLVYALEDERINAK